jgi:hypothetical protein
LYLMPYTAIGRVAVKIYSSISFLILFQGFVHHLFYPVI